MSENQSIPPVSGQPVAAGERIVPIVMPALPPTRRSAAGFVLRVFVGLVLLGSIATNLWLLVLLGMTMAGPFQTNVLKEGNDKQVVAVCAVTGLLDPRAAGRFEAFADIVLKDSHVKAVVLRVDSPGGYVGASDEMYNEVRRIRKSGRKVVVSMGSVAASGGYYIAAPADTILAEPTTTTGSIGVLANWVALRGTLAKIGAEPVMMQSARAKDWKQAMNPVDPPNDRQRAHIQARLDDMQKRFEQVVVEGRGERLKVRTVARQVVVEGGREPVAMDEVEPFNGKVYGPEEAMALGLVDGVGYVHEATAKAAELAGLSSPKVVEYKSRPTLLGMFRGAEEQAAPMGVSRELIDELQTPRIMLIWKAQ